jgi:hypothetical protein
LQGNGNLFLEREEEKRGWLGDLQAGWLGKLDSWEAGWPGMRGDFVVDWYDILGDLGVGITIENKLITKT